MVDLLISLLSFISIVLSHPLDNVETENYNKHDFLSKYSEYIMPEDGYVEDINIENDLYQIILRLNDEHLVVYSGLSETTRSEGDIVKKGELIGIDRSISNDTIFILFLFSESQLFPQLINNEMSFFVEYGRNVYSVEDCTFLNKGYNMDDGLFITYQLDKSGIIVTYKHLSAADPITGPDVKQGNIIGRTGDSGFIEKSKLSLTFLGENNYKAIYLSATPICNIVPCQ